jgi:TolA-binding protein
VIVHKMISVSVLTGIAALAMAGSASAQSATEIRLKALEKREAAQAQAIIDGRRDGSVTIWEKARLNQEQRRIDKLQADVARDGKITRDEYYKVKEAQNDAGRHIASEKHDNQVRGWWWRTFSR